MKVLPFSSHTTSDGEDGFTIIEVLVAAFVLVLAALAVFMGFAGAIHGIQRSREMQQGVSVAQREMEHLRVIKYSDLGIAGAAMAPEGDAKLPTSRLSSPGGTEFDVARPMSKVEMKKIVPGTLAPTPVEVNSLGGTKVKVYRFVVCEEEDTPPVGECAAKRIVVDVVPVAADNQSGYQHSYYELQSTVVDPEGGS
jgi:hypothetical protein